MMLTTKVLSNSCTDLIMLLMSRSEKMVCIVAEVENCWNSTVKERRPGY